MHTLRLGLMALVVFFFVIAVAGAQTTAVPSATAAAPALPRGWMKVASLRPGERLSVQVRFAPAPTLCTLVWIDNTALACEGDASSGTSTRLVFPAAQVYSVARDRTQDGDRSCGTGKRLLIGAAIGGTLGGLLLSRSSASAGLSGRCWEPELEARSHWGHRASARQPGRR